MLLPKPAVQYTIQALPETHYFHVRCEIQQANADGYKVSLPAWIPGSYMIREFAKHLVDFKVSQDNQPLTWQKIDKNTWHCAPSTGVLVIEYSIFAAELFVRGAHLDTTHGYFNGTHVFLQVQGLETKACAVNIVLPTGAAYADWKIASSLSPIDADNVYGFGHYHAADYDELIDHPVEMGHFTLDSFDVAGVQHDIALYGQHRADMPRLCADLQRICQGHLALFGELPVDIQRYVFLVQATGDAYGGLEHRSSCSLMCKRDDLPHVRRDAEQPSKAYQRFLGLCSHEYLHLWHVKRIKPAVFIPYQLHAETYTRQLWIFEGITSYFDDLNLLRCRLISPDDYLTLVEQIITRVWQGAGRFKQSLTDSSLDSWVKLYKPDSNTPNAAVSYYSKGALLALALDLTLRLHSQITLDTVMQDLWQTHGKVLKGVPEGYVEKLISRLSGLDLDDFFQRYLYGCEDIPLAELLTEFGLCFTLYPARSQQDTGGQAVKNIQMLPSSSLGIRCKNSQNGLNILSIRDGSAAQKVGLMAGDVLLAIDGLKVKPNQWEAQIAQYAVGETVEVHIFRRDELMCFQVTLQAAINDTCTLDIIGNADSVCTQRRIAWWQALES